MIDTHCHLNFKAFEKDADEVIGRTLAENIWMINVGSQLETSKKAVELAGAFNAPEPRSIVAEKYPQGVFAAIGLHPGHVTGHLLKNKLDSEELAAQESVKDFNIDDYRRLALGPGGRRVVAIGEIGLDYYYRPKGTARLEEFKNLQKRALLAQMDLAKELNLPIIFHCRSAHSDLIRILDARYQILDTSFRGVVHCFAGTWKEAEEYLKLGLYIGFTGIIFKQIPGIDFKEVIKKTPLDKILVETDAPYLTPPAASPERNEPIFVKYIAEEIAKIKKLSYQEVSETTTLNARKLFGI